MSGPESELEWWDSKTLGDESRLFREQYGELHGLTESELRNLLGEPDQVLHGSTAAKEGRIVIQADVDWRYCSLLPHTVVGISIADKKVEAVYYLPKIRRHAPQTQIPFDGYFAPE